MVAGLQDEDDLEVMEDEDGLEVIEEVLEVLVQGGRVQVGLGPQAS